MRSRLCLAVVLMFFILDLRGQRDFRLIDSLKTVLPTQTGSDAFETLDTLTYELLDFQNEEALKYCRVLYRMSFAMNDSLKIVHAGARLGASLRRLEKNDSAIWIYNYILPIAKRHSFTKYQKYITNSLGGIYAFRANYDGALELYLESLALRRKSGRLDEVSIVLNNIAIVYYKMKSYEKALSFFDESLRIKREIRDYYDYDNILINSGLSHAYLKHYQKAIKILWEGLSFFGDSTQLYVMANGYFGLGVAYHGLNDLPKAHTYFKRAFNFSKESDHYRFQADNLVYLGKISFALGKKQTGVDQLLEAEKISLIYEYNELLIAVYEELIRMFRSMNNLDRLTVYQSKYIELKQRVYSAKLIENLADLETRLKAQENANMLSQQKEALEAGNQLIAKNRFLIISALGTVLLLGFLLYMLHRNTRLRKNVNNELEEKVAMRTKELAEVLEQLQESNIKQNATIQHAHEIVLSHTRTLIGLKEIITDEKSIHWKQQMEIQLHKLNLLARDDLK